MNEREVITWRHCRFINAEFNHYTYDGIGENTAYFLEHDITLHRLEYISCTELANDIHACKVLAFYDVSFYQSGNRKKLMSVTPCKD